MIKEIIRRSVELHDDYMLRMAHIATLQALLQSLAVEAQQQIKPMYLPLWYVTQRPMILVREDVDPEVLRWVCTQCYDAQFGERHPIYPAFYAKRYLIGNKTTEPKAYLKAAYPYGLNLPKTYRTLVGYLQAHLGAGFATEPNDIDGKPILI